MAFVHGSENILIDEKDERWLDLLSGILNVSLGHGSIPVRDALRDVLGTSIVNTYDRPTVYTEEFTKLLKAYEPAYDWKLLNTGAEAVERAIQVVACAINRRPTVAVLRDSFHGKSLSMACARYEVPWGNPMGIVEVDPYRGHHNPKFDVLIYEPIGGWAGKRADEAALRELCEANGAYLVADEMITGFGRCGTRFLSVSADMIISGKGVAQGVPLAVLGIGSRLSMLKLPIGWNTTCGGNNLSASVGLSVLRHLMLNEEFYHTRTAFIEKELQSMGFDACGALGFRAIENPKRMREIFEARRIIVSWHGNTMRVGPSFVTTHTQLTELRETLAQGKL